MDRNSIELAANSMKETISGLQSKILLLENETGLMEEALERSRLGSTAAEDAAQAHLNETLRAHDDALREQEKVALERLNVIEAELSQSQASIIAKQAIIDDLLQRNHDLEEASIAKTAEAEIEILELRESFESLEETNALSTAKANKLQDELSMTRDTLHTVLTNGASKETELQEKGRTIEQLEAELDAFFIRYEEASADALRAKENVRQLQTSLNVLSSDYEKSTERYEHQVAELEGAKLVEISAFQHKLEVSAR